MNNLKNSDKIKQPYRERIERYVKTLYEYFGENLIGVLVFGSIARGEAKITDKYESDIDILAIIENLPPRFSIDRMKLRWKVPTIYSIVSKWITKDELDQYLAAKTGFVLDAFDDGIIVYDPYDYLAQKRIELFDELKRKGVVRKPNLGWVFPIKKIGEKIEY